MITAIIIISIISQIILSLFVLLRSKDNLSNKLFFYLSISMMGWAFTNYLSITYINSDHLTLLVRLVLSFVVIQNSLFYLFSKTFPNHKWKISKRHRYTYIGISVFVFILTFTNLIFKSVTVVNNEQSTKVSFGIVLFIIFSALSIIIALKTLVHNANISKSRQKIQFTIIIVASILNWVVVPLTNFVFTQVFHTTFFAMYAPIYTLIFSSIIAYAIVAQKLFDIRAAVARSVGYVLVIATIALIYGAILFGVINVLFPGQNHEFFREVLSIILIAPLALSFQSLKKFFDRVSDRLFYRDNYDSQEVLDEIGDIFVSQIDLNKILNNTRRVLSKALKPDYIEYVLIRNNKPYLEPHNHWESKLDYENITSHILNQHNELVVVDELESTNALKKYLDDAQVGLSLRLKTENEIVGYILFGHKNSGNIYGTKDTELLLIVANEISIAIKNALRFEEIQKFNITLQYKVEEETRQLRKANERLKELDDVKDDFISMASHQLRTPLTSIKGYLGMVVEGEAGKINKDQKKFLNEALTSSRRMVTLVTDMLNVSRIEAGKFFIDRKPVNLSKITEEIVEEVEGIAKQKSVTIKFNKPADFPIVNVDEEKIGQVIMNFIDNAIHYSKPEGQIDIVLNEDDYRVELLVKDDGIGVPKEAQKHLFTKFYRAENAKKARTDGTGIGLYLAKEVISSQGGKLIFTSQENKGSTFGFSFPKDDVKIK